MSSTTGMTARDYQHKRFRSRESNNNNSNISSHSNNSNKNLNSGSSSHSVITNSNSNHTPRLPQQPLPHQQLVHTTMVQTIDSTPLTPKIITPQSASKRKISLSHSLRVSSENFKPPLPLDADTAHEHQEDEQEEETDPLKKLMNGLDDDDDDDDQEEETDPLKKIMGGDEDDEEEEEDTDPLKKLMNGVDDDDDDDGGAETDPLQKIKMIDDFLNTTTTNTTMSMSAVDETPTSPYVHKPTASNGGLTTESPMKVTDSSMRYSLSKGLQQSPTSMLSSPPSSPPLSSSSVRRDKNFRRASDQGAGSIRRSPHHDTRRASEPYASRTSGSTKIRKQDPNAYKIFILLLQPKSKIFELIQLIYNPNDTSVGDILTMIPENATEQALGNQTYVGLCRPKTQEELLNKDLLASEARPGLISAKITLGEILVAIPKGYTGQDVAVLSKQILSNPKIVKLLKRADPLAPKKKRSSRSSRHRRPSSKSSSRENVDVLEKLGEEAEEEVHGSFDDDENKMKAAMKKAKAQALEANAECDSNGSLSRSNSASSQNGGEDVSLMSESTGSSSLDESFSSWSKSFDASFSAHSSVCSGVSKRAARRRERQARRLRILKQCAVGAFVAMIAFYVFDPRGKNNNNAQAQNDLVRKTPMGLTGVFQCLFLLLALYKVERLVRAATNAASGEDSNSNIKSNTLVSSTSYSNNSNNNNNNNAKQETEHKCPFLRASNAAMKRFKAKYAKKLKRAASSKKFSMSEEQNYSNNIINKTDASASKRLRNFSLRPAAVVRGHSADEDDNGNANGGRSM